MVRRRSRVWLPRLGAAVLLPVVVGLAASGCAGDAAAPGAAEPDPEEWGAPPRAAEVVEEPFVEALPGSPGDEPREPLERTWMLEEVRYKAGRPIVAKSSGGITLGFRRSAGWSDGCNLIRGSYEVDGDEMTIHFGSTTLMDCSGRPEDVHYEQVTHYRLDGSRLTLRTPKQTYVLSRFPYSQLSEHAWSLYSISDTKARVTRNVDRFRMEYSELFLEVKDDRSFRFIDLDRDEHTGTLRVERAGDVRFVLDPASEQRVAEKPRKTAPLRDSWRGYEPTVRAYPTTYADRLRWRDIETYRVYRDHVRFEGGRDHATQVLELRGDGFAYRFVPR